MMPTLSCYMSDGILQGVRIVTRRRIESIRESALHMDSESYRALTFYSVVLMLEQEDTKVDIMFSFNDDLWRLINSSYSGWDKKYRMIYASTSNEDGNIGFLIENTDKRLFENLIGTANIALRTYRHERPHSSTEWEYLRSIETQKRKVNDEIKKIMDRQIMLRTLDDLEGLKPIDKPNEMIDKKLFEV